ncbi:MAG TPA: sialidase family protein, partial [Gaiellaceae bacterium]|nr:sialidase family protein [Gaiellaceae bacterium]
MRVVRRIALLLAPLVTLAFAPSALGWTTLSGGVDNDVIPSMLVTKAGTELVSFETRPSDTIEVSRNRGTPKVLVSGDPAAQRTQLVQQPNGTILLYFPNASGVARMTSVDDGATWTGPVQTQSRDVGAVQSAAVAPDGTPYFTQDGTGFVNVFKGLNGETSKNVYTTCCGYDSTVAVDSTGVVQVAFFSNATANGAFVYEALDANLNVTGTPTSLAPSL